MSKKKKRSKSARRRAARGMGLINTFYAWYTVPDALDELWNQFHYSMICDQRGDMDVEQRRMAFFYYERMKDLIKGSADVLGAK